MIDWPKTGTPGCHWVEYDEQGNLLRSGYETPKGTVDIKTTHQPVSVNDLAARFEVVRGVCDNCHAQRLWIDLVKQGQFMVCRSPATCAPAW